MLRPDSAHRRDVLTDHAIALIEEAGMAAVTFPAIARRVRITRQSLTAWVKGDRGELLDIVTGRFVGRWRELLDGRLHGHGVLCFLPLDEEEVRWTRVRLAMEEQERTTPDLGGCLVRLRLYERELLEAAHPMLRRESANGDVEVLMTLLDGLRAALTRVTDPMSPERARRLFWDECSRLAGDQADWLSPYAPWGPSAGLPAGRQSEQGGG